MIEGGNWWRANEIVMRHLIRRFQTRYRCRDKARSKPSATRAGNRGPVIDDQRVVHVGTVTNVRIACTISRLVAACQAN
jgi:hypothetical protein